MSDHRQIIRNYAEAFSRGDIEEVCGFFSPDAIIHGVLDGRLESARNVWSELATAFGVTLEIEALCVEGSVVVARYTERGTFRAAFRGYAPTGQAYSVPAMHWFEFSGDKIVRRWGARSTTSIANQIGMSQANEEEA